MGRLAMRRLILALTAVLLATGSPLAADPAWADPGRGFERRDERRGGGWERRRDWDRPRGDPRGRYERPRAYPPAAGYSRPRALRPGGYLPPVYREARIYDYGRYRLRPPPHGYGWYLVGDDFLLVSLLDGQVFDIIVN